MNSELLAGLQRACQSHITCTAAPAPGLRDLHTSRSWRKWVNKTCQGPAGALPQGHGVGGCCGLWRAPGWSLPLGAWAVGQS